MDYVDNIGWKDLCNFEVKGLFIVLSCWNCCLEIWF